MTNDTNKQNRSTALSSLELLAPAGGLEQLIAAVNFGANAVYLGLDQFSMRAKAKNFTIDELKQGVKIAHDAGVKVHVTLNIQMHEADLATLPSYFEAVQEAGADAVIVGDIGAMMLAKKHAPNVELHVSTQAAVANSESAKAFYELGAKRVVLAREMALSEIAEFRSKIPADLEVESFVHGAQCMAQSGRCLISSYLCDRSANLGACTQPCRWGYHVVEEKRLGKDFDIEEANGLTYVFNAADLCMIDHLQELADAGVNSIKIEGRNKKAFYVATVVGAYRRVLDGCDPADVHEELECISHRPYSEGFYFGEPRQTLDFDGYTQSTLHVADVLGCTPLHGGITWQLKLRCRNKIRANESIEALVSNAPVKTLQLNDFVWIDSEGIERPQDEFNRPGEIYTAISSAEVPAGSFLRKREDRITSRVGV